MNYLLVAIFVASISLISAKINTTNIPATAYLFSYFNNNEFEGLHIAYSTDGYTFEALNNDKPLMAPLIGDKILRDPCLLYGPDGLFHLVWTTSWKSKEFGHSTSKDLIHWSTEELVPAMHNFSQTQTTWAPEVIYDSDKKHYLIFWSSLVKGAGTRDYSRIYSTTTTDFKTYTPTKLYYEGGEDTIDATLLHDTDGKWIMFIKVGEQGQMNIRIVTGNGTPDGPWGKLSGSISPTSYISEGPTSVKIGNNYNVYYDKYSQNQMGMIQSTDLKNWKDLSSQVHFPPHAKHGTVIAVSRDVVTMLSKGGL